MKKNGKHGNELEVIIDHDAQMKIQDWELQFVPHVQETRLAPIPVHLLLVLFIVPLNDIADSLDERNILPLDSITESVSLPPRCGDHVPVSDHCLLIQRIEVLRNDQYIAVLQHDPLDDKQEGDPVYVYGKLYDL